jgi:hypothetical protein
MYAEQISARKKVDKTRDIDATLSLQSIGVSSKATNFQRDASTTEMIEALINFLEETGRLHDDRPASLVEQDNPTFVLEDMVASRYVLPDSAGAKDYGFENLSMWVSEPIQPLLDREDRSGWTAEGTFLYLMESNKDDKVTDGPYSAFSALDRIYYRFADPLSPTPNLPKRQDPRKETRSPREVLLASGAAQQPARTIRSLYRTRYISDDQYVMIDGVVCRCFDVAAYPIYVADA